MPTQTGSIDLRASKKAQDEAKKYATNFILEHTDNATYFHADDSSFDPTTGNSVKVTDLIEVIREGTTMAQFGAGDGDAVILGDESSGNYSNIDSSGFEINVDDNVVASFGQTAKIGRDNSANLEITDGGITGRNAEAVPVFDVSTDGAELDLGAEYSFNKIGSWPVRSSSLYKTISQSYYLGDIPNNVTLDWKSVAQESLHVRFGGNATQHTLTSISVTSKSNCTSTNGTYTAQANVRVEHDGYSAAVTYSVTVKYTYVASTQTVTVSMEVRLTSTFNHEDVLWFGMAARMAFAVTTKAPSFTLGTRNSSSDSGGFSLAAGRDLYADGDYQTVLGKYNASDTDQALIIGGGTGDSARSNIFTVGWDGAVNGAKISAPAQVSGVTASNMNNAGFNVYRCGNVVQVSGYGAPTGSGSLLLLSGLPAPVCAMSIPVQCDNGSSSYVNLEGSGSAGYMYWGGGSSGSTIRFQFTYITNY